ncbi:hypothetical protein ABZ723_27910, partial [Streptomyces sp. NPDC006700]|uniref:hypothetical protein n=1 Tax=Streptomyces sp. NPDC006700 TaxID=3154479 RepID=UPI00340E21A0
ATPPSSPVPHQPLPTTSRIPGMKITIYSWSTKRVEIILLSEGADPSAATRTWWREAVDCLREEAGDVLLITGPRFERLDQLSVSDYRRLTPLAKPHQKFSNE